MIEVAQVSVVSQGGNGSYVPQQITPGWYFDPFYGWYYLYPDGSKYIGNPVTGQVFAPMAFFAEYEYPATGIRSDAPINILEGDDIRVDFKFYWMGEARTIWFRLGSCKKILANYDEGDVVRVSIGVTASTAYKAYTGSGTFTYVSGFPAPGGDIQNKHLFILPEGIEWDVVYTNAFGKVIGEFKDLSIDSYQRLE